MEPLKLMILRIRKFWRYNIQYALSRHIMHIGLWLMPECSYKSLLLKKMYEALDEVKSVIENKGIIS